MDIVFELFILVCVVKFFFINLCFAVGRGGCNTAKRQASGTDMPVARSGTNRGEVGSTCNKEPCKLLDIPPQLSTKNQYGDVHFSA